MGLKLGLTLVVLILTPILGAMLEVNLFVAAQIVKVPFLFQGVKKAPKSGFKAVIASGYPGPEYNGVVTEVVDIEDGDTNCQGFPDYPQQPQGVTGGLLNGDTLLFCGGFTTFGILDECFIFKSDEVSIGGRMLFRRREAASIVINDRYAHSLNLQLIRIFQRNHFQTLCYRRNGRTSPA